MGDKEFENIEVYVHTKEEWEEWKRQLEKYGQ